MYLRGKPGEKTNVECADPRVKYCGGSVMVSGCFGGETVGDLGQGKHGKRKISFDFAKT